MHCWAPWILSFQAWHGGWMMHGSGCFMLFKRSSTLFEPAICQNCGLVSWGSLVSNGKSQNGFTDSRSIIEKFRCFSPRSCFASGGDHIELAWISHAGCHARTIDLKQDSGRRRAPNCWAILEVWSFHYIGWVFSCSFLLPAFYILYRYLWYIE